MDTACSTLKLVSIYLNHLNENEKQVVDAEIKHTILTKTVSTYDVLGYKTTQENVFSMQE